MHTRVGLLSFAGVLPLVLSIHASQLFAQDRCQTPAPTPEQQQAIRNHLNQWMQAGGRTAPAITTIPVAFHVVRFNDGSANVTDAQIQAQVDTLNAGYATTNFRFSLRSITRVNRSDWQYPTYNSQQESSMKQALAVDPAHVLNFYTADLPGGDLGFARFPSEFTETSYMHGVVCDYGSLPGGHITGFNQGKTGTHEIGHYVGLWHTFQGGCTPPGDEVEDTPYEASPASGCPEGRNTCPAPGLDPIHNFMDYSTDPCMYEFTQGQARRADSIMALYRPSILGAQLYVDQQRADGISNAGATVGRWNGSSFTGISVPGFVSTSMGVREVLRAFQDTVQGPNEKYRLWVQNSVELLDTVQNHRGFTMTGNGDSLIGRFHPTCAGVTIKTDLLDLPGTTGGTIQFHDPWYIDYQDPAYGNNWRNRGMQEPRQFHTRSLTGQFAGGWTPDFTTTYAPHPYPYNGVFLNEGHPNWNPPYYSVGAPNPNTIGGYQSYFQGWKVLAGSASFQNPSACSTAVVFTLENTTVAAAYKGHLLSGSAGAVSNPSQRKIVRAGNNRFYAVYESAGHIWLTMSDDGLTWTGEKKVSYDEPTGFVNRAPSISIRTIQPPAVDVAWEAYGLQGSTRTANVYVRSLDLLSLNDLYPLWTTTCTSTGDFTTSPVMAPRITDYSSHSMVAWYDPAGSGAIKYYVPTIGSGGTLATGRPTSFTLAPNPLGMADSPVHDSLGWGLAWSVGGTLYYRTAGRRVADGQIALGTPQIVSTGGGMIRHVSLVHTEPTYPYLPAISWFQNDNEVPPPPVQEWVPSPYTVRFKQRSGIGWGAATVWQVSAPTEPALTFNYNSGMSQFSLFCSVDGTVYQADRMYGMWMPMTSITPGFTPSPSISVPGYGGDGTEILLSRTGSSPYALQPLIFSNINALSTQEVLPTAGTCDGRALVLATPRGLLRIEMMSPGRPGRRASFAYLSDTLAISGTSAFEEATSTKAFNGSDTLDLTIRVLATSGLGKGVQARLALLGSSTGQVLRVFDTLNLESPRQVSYERMIAGTLPNQQVKLRFAPTGLREIGEVSMEQWFFPDFTSGQRRESEAAGVAEARNEAIPTDWQVSSAYPNPFNPSTRIRFDLPEPSTVTLAVFDLLGRKVADLAAGEYEAGYHTATWNAAGGATGVYLARFTATSTTSGVAYTRTHKLVLMK